MPRACGLSRGMRVNTRRPARRCWERHGRTVVTAISAIGLAAGFALHAALAGGIGNALGSKGSESLTRCRFRGSSTPLLLSLAAGSWRQRRSKRSATVSFLFASSHLRSRHGASGGHGVRLRRYGPGAACRSCPTTGSPARSRQITSRSDRDSWSSRARQFHWTVWSCPASETRMRP